MPDFSVSNLIEGFCRSCDRYPERPALEVGAEVMSYAALERRAAALARVIVEQETAPMAAFLAYRSAGAYTAVLGILAAGRGYVPLNPKRPRKNKFTFAERGAPWVRLDVHAGNERAIAQYHAGGYQVVNRHSSACGIEYVAMMRAGGVRGG